MAAKGWKRIEQSILVLSDRNAASASANDAVRILPARAMRKAYRSTFDESSDEGKQQAEAAIERLDDSDLDAFVAMVDGKPAGRFSYLSVGDVARLSDLRVLLDFESGTVAGTLVHHALQLARRMSPKVIVARETDGAHMERLGFTQAGCDVCFLAA
jgi:predicted N-acetyltransferase YhbS